MEVCGQLETLADLPQRIRALLLSRDLRKNKLCRREESLTPIGFEPRFLGRQPHNLMYVDIPAGLQQLR